jgi:hypothetical protein
MVWCESIWNGDGGHSRKAKNVKNVRMRTGGSMEAYPLAACPVNKDSLNRFHRDLSTGEAF